MRKVVGQVSLVFLFASFFTLEAIFAQTESDNSKLSAVYTIQAIQDTLEISKTGFYLAEVKDLRINKTNNGNITEEIGKNALVFKDSLPLYLGSFIYPQASPIDGLLSPISLQVEKFKCFASTDGKIDEAQLYIKVYFYDPKKLRLVHSFERTFNYKRKSRPDFISQLIYTAFKAAFSGLRDNNSASIYKATAGPVPNNSTTVQPTYNGTYQPTKDETSDANIKGRTKYTIPLPVQKMLWSNPIYCLSTIKDTRSYNQNEGSVLSGLFNRRAEAKVDSSLEYYLSNTINTTNETDKKPLTLHINAFKCSESQTALGEKGTLFFSANLVMDSAGNRYTVYKNTISIDSIDDNDITNYWPSIISKTMTSYFGTFSPTTPSPFIIQTSGQAIAKRKLTNEIIVEGFYYKKRYFWNKTELKKLKDFDLAFEETMSYDAKLAFKTSKDLIRTGRAFTVIGGIFLSYSMLDFLLLEDKSIKNWYRADPESSSNIMVLDKKLFIWGGVTSILSGFICRTIGKNELLKAIGLHNKSVAEKLSINVSPDLYNQGCLFQLNFQLGQR